jgi:hypothetical protein
VIKGVATALHDTARAFRHEQGDTLAGYVDDAAARVEVVADSVRQREWRDLLGEVDDVARRHPELVFLGAIASGFIFGRLLDDAMKMPPEPQSGSSRERSIDKPPGLSSGAELTTVYGSDAL